MKETRTPTGDRAAPDDDAALIERVARRDTQALEALYDRYAHIVYGMALRILRNAELAEEVVQETFWRVWRRSDTFQAGRGRVAAWIFGIAHNLAIDELRRQRARPSAVSLDSERAAPYELEDQGMDVVATAIEAERRRMITNALTQLPTEQREVIELAYFGGLSQSEIATRLGSPIGTVKTRVRLGIQKLRDILIARGLRKEDIDV